MSLRIQTQMYTHTSYMSNIQSSVHRLKRTHSKSNILPKKYINICINCTEKNDNEMFVVFIKKFISSKHLKMHFIYVLYHSNMIRTASTLSISLYIHPRIRTQTYTHTHTSRKSNIYCSSIGTSVLLPHFSVALTAAYSKLHCTVTHSHNGGHILSMRTNYTPLQRSLLVIVFRTINEQFF